MANLEKAWSKTLQWEGGEVDDPADPGGLTKFGISQRAYPDLDIRSLTLEDAADLYRVDYWNKVKGDAIEDQQNAETLFDMAVNAGVTAASRMAQGVVGSRMDGIIGPKTLAKLNACKGFAMDFTIARIQYYTDIRQSKPSNSKFFFGWVRRALSFISV